MTASTASPVASDEAALVLQAQKGDRQAFTALVERYWNSVYRWLYHLSRHRQTAEDLTQDTLLKAFAALGSFQAYQLSSMALSHRLQRFSQSPRGRTPYQAAACSGCR